MAGEGELPHFKREQQKERCTCMSSARKRKNSGACQENCAFFFLPVHIKNKPFSARRCKILLSKNTQIRPKQKRKHRKGEPQ